MSSRVFVTVAAAAVVLAGCSSKPRNFAPVLGAAPADSSAYEAQWLVCREQVAASIKAGSGRAASAVGGAAVGVGSAAAVGAAASTATYATYGAAMAALGATIIMAPVAAIGGAWGISKIKKTKKERAIKAATAECLAKAGYPVENWRVMKKQEVRALPAAAAVNAKPAAAAPKAASQASAPAATAPATAGEAAAPPADPR